MELTRRGFLAGAGAAAFPPGVLAAAEPDLRFGVLSDVHIGGKPDAAERAE